MQPTIKIARDRIALAFRYVDNVVCLLIDHIPGFKRDKAKRDRIALDIIKLIFE